MAAYYNEHDPHKAEWLRQLIAKGLIAPGEVDERDIRKVEPGDLEGFTQCHFFAGIGVWSYALRLAGWPDDRECNDYSHRMVELASVPTPDATNRVRSEKTRAITAQQRLERCGQTTTPLYLSETALLASTATPRSEDSQCAGAHRDNCDSLHSQTKLATVASPSARDWKDTPGMSATGVDPDGSIRQRLDQLPQQAQLADSGAGAIGGTPRTASSGQLNPAYSRWLQGLPVEWDIAAIQSSRLRKQATRQKRESTVCVDTETR